MTIESKDFKDFLKAENEVFDFCSKRGEEKLEIMKIGFGQDSVRKSVKYNVQGFYENGVEITVANCNPSIDNANIYLTQTIYLSSSEICLPEEQWKNYLEKLKINVKNNVVRPYHKTME